MGLINFKKYYVGGIVKITRKQFLCIHSLRLLISPQSIEIDNL